MAEEKAEVLNVLREGANAKWAHKIVANWNHLRWHTEWDYWNALEKRASDAGFTSLPDDDVKVKYDAKKLNSAIHAKRKKPMWYGLGFNIAEYKNKPVRLQIERASNPSWNIERNVIFGIPETDENRRNELAPYFPDRNSNQWWAYFTDLIPAINFEKFSDMTVGRRTLDLCNPTKREEIVESHWQQIKNFIDVVRAKLGANA